MADITLRSPFADLRRLLDEWRDDDWRLGRAFPAALDSPERLLAVDVSESDGQYVVKTSLPGFKREEISVEVGNGGLTISAERFEDQEEQGEHYLRRERYSGSAMRQVALTGVTADSQVDASLKDGVLRVSVAVPTAKSAKKIDVREG